MVFTLNDNADNAEVIARYDGQSVSKVTLSGRTLYKDGSWNTLCLPFDVALEGSPLAGDGVDVRTLESASFDVETLTLNFTASGTVTTMKAGKPYLIKWNDTGVNLTEADLVFRDVTINKTANDVTCDLGSDRSVSFKGTYASKEYTADDRAVLLLGAGGTLYYPQSGASIGAQRAYFELNGITAGDITAGVRSFVLNFGDDDGTTGISSVEHSPSVIDRSSEAWYTLDGCRLADKPTQRGVYINNGKKIVIK